MPLFFTRLLPNFASCIRWLVDLLSFRKSLITRKRVWWKLIGSNSNSEGRNCRRSYLSDILLTNIRRSWNVSAIKEAGDSSWFESSFGMDLALNFPPEGRPRDLSSYLSKLHAYVIHSWFVYDIVVLTHLLLILKSLAWSEIGQRKNVIEGNHNCSFSVFGSCDELGRDARITWEL